ncbi:MAG: hypothetical protein MAGBODY4_00569 [Candidatus Marinimicrobia bacterium]|nr:hypothetical protein [Candidatus Neomarinimicrobiota bacterium]
MTKPIPLEEGNFYHIYNRGNNGEVIFYDEEDYQRFLKKYIQYCYPALDTYAYCLMGNHFHLLVKVRTEGERRTLIAKDPFRGRDPERVHHLTVSRQLSHLFNSHAQYINKNYERTGSLFEKPFKRKRIDHRNYLKNVIQYIHWNPQFHIAATDFAEYPYSSYQRYISDDSTRLNCDSVFHIFGGSAKFIESHQKIALPPGDDYTFDLN